MKKNMNNTKQIMSNTNYNIRNLAIFLICMVCLNTNINTINSYGIKFTAFRSTDTLNFKPNSYRLSKSDKNTNQNLGFNSEVPQDYWKKTNASREANVSDETKNINEEAALAKNNNNIKVAAIKPNLEEKKTELVTEINKDKKKLEVIAKVEQSAESKKGDKKPVESAVEQSVESKDEKKSVESEVEQSEEKTAITDQNVELTNDEAELKKDEIKPGEPTNEKSAELKKEKPTEPIVESSSEEKKEKPTEPIVESSSEEKKPVEPTKEQSDELKEKKPVKPSVGSSSEEESEDVEVEISKPTAKGKGISISTTQNEDVVEESSNWGYGDDGKPLTYEEFKAKEQADKQKKAIKKQKDHKPKAPPSGKSLNVNVEDEDIKENSAHPKKPTEEKSSKVEGEEIKENSAKPKKPTEEKSSKVEGEEIKENSAKPKKPTEEKSSDVDGEVFTCPKGSHLVKGECKFDSAQPKKPTEQKSAAMKPMTKEEKCKSKIENCNKVNVDMDQCLCDKCNDGFATLSILNAHLKTQTPETNNQLECHAKILNCQKYDKDGICESCKVKGNNKLTLILANNADGVLNQYCSPCASSITTKEGFKVCDTCNQENQYYLQNGRCRLIKNCMKFSAKTQQCEECIEGMIPQENKCYNKIDGCKTQVKDECITCLSSHIMNKVAGRVCWKKLHDCKEHDFELTSRIVKEYDDDFVEDINEHYMEINEEFSIKIPNGQKQKGLPQNHDEAVQNEEQLDDEEENEEEIDELQKPNDTITTNDNNPIKTNQKSRLNKILRKAGVNDEAMIKFNDHINTTPYSEMKFPDIMMEEAPILICVKCNENFKLDVFGECQKSKNLCANFNKHFKVCEKCIEGHVLGNEGNCHPKIKNCEIQNGFLCMSCAKNYFFKDFQCLPSACVEEIGITLIVKEEKMDLQLRRQGLAIKEDKSSKLSKKFLPPAPISKSKMMKKSNMTFIVRSSTEIRRENFTKKEEFIFLNSILFDSQKNFSYNRKYIYNPCRVCEEGYILDIFNYTCYLKGKQAAEEKKELSILDNVANSHFKNLEDKLSLLTNEIHSLKGDLKSMKPEEPATLDIIKPAERQTQSLKGLKKLHQIQKGLENKMNLKKQKLKNSSVKSDQSLNQKLIDKPIESKLNNKGKKGDESVVEPVAEVVPEAEKKEKVKAEAEKVVPEVQKIDPKVASEIVNEHKAPIIGKVVNEDKKKKIQDKMIDIANTYSKDSEVNVNEKINQKAEDMINEEAIIQEEVNIFKSQYSELPYYTSEKQLIIGCDVLRNGRCLKCSNSKLRPNKNGMCTMENCLIMLSPTLKPDNTIHLSDKCFKCKSGFYPTADRSACMRCSDLVYDNLEDDIPNECAFCPPFMRPRYFAKGDNKCARIIKKCAVYSTLDKCIGCSEGHVLSNDNKFCFDKTKITKASCYHMNHNVLMKYYLNAENVCVSRKPEQINEEEFEDEKMRFR